MLKKLILLLLFAGFSACCNVNHVCTQRQLNTSYLDEAIDMISKAKDNIRQCNEMVKAVDCADIFEMGYKRSGVYEIWPLNRVTGRKSLAVYCDMHTDGGGWTVIQRRGDYERAIDYFFKDWKCYKRGFGDIEEDFWLGNDNIFALTNQKLYSVRFDLRDVEGNRSYAHYDKFWIDDEFHNYTSHISDYRGNAGDSMTHLHNIQKFSTKDRDNDMSRNQHCAHRYKGGWWYSFCHQANLNGLYHKGRHESFADGVNWFTWKGYHESLEWTEIKIRPKNFRHCTEKINV